MSNHRFNPFCGPLLFIFILQIANTLALDCYGCLKDSYYGPISNPACLQDVPPVDLIVNETDKGPGQKGLAMAKKELSDLKIKMTKGPFCFKYAEYKRVEGTDEPELTMFRYVTPEGPEKSALDESGCLFGPDGKYCFCDTDKCNKGQVDPPPQKPKAIANIGPKSEAPSPTSGVSFTLPSVVLLTVSSLMLINKRS